MSIALLVMTDGRDHHLARTLDSAAKALEHPHLRWIIVHDDGGDEQHSSEVLALTRQAFGRVDRIRVLGSPQRRGFGGAIAHAWRTIAAMDGIDHVFHLEDDFVFNKPAPLNAMRNLLDEYPHLAQVALKRQPWNPSEQAVGGIVEQHPADYNEQTTFTGATYLEHLRFFTTNPCLYRATLCETGWPEVPESEGRFTIQLREAGFAFAIYGARGEPPWVHHIGAERVGVGY